MTLKSLFIIAISTVLFAAFILLVDSMSLFLRTGLWRDISVMSEALPFVITISALVSAVMRLSMRQQSDH